MKSVNIKCYTSISVQSMYIYSLYIMFYYDDIWYLCTYMPYWYDLLLTTGHFSQLRGEYDIVNSTMSSPGGQWNEIYEQ